MHKDRPTVYLAIKFHSDHRNRELVDRISTEMESRGLTTVCVARDFEKWGEIKLDASDLMQIALDAVRQSDAVVIEFSEKGVGLGIEAGYASAFEIPIFVLHRQYADVSPTLRGVASAVVEYTDGDSLNEAIDSLVAGIDPQSSELDRR
jgi:nucleoside 2-deoxyribosyltransferase